MADQNIKINVGSSYDGSGMSKALGGVDNLSRAAGKAASAVGKIGGAFESLGGTAGKTVGAVSGALGALATGGVFGAIIFGITAIVSWFQKMGDESKNVEKLKKSFEEIKEQTDKYTSSLSTALSKIDKQIAAIDKLTAAHQRLAKAEADAQKAAITDELEKMGEGPDKVEASARANLAMTRIDAQASKSAADAKVEGADNKIKALNEKIENVGKTIQLLDGDLEKYDQALAKAQQRLYARQERRASKDEIQVAKDELKAAEKARNEFVTKTYNPQVIAKNDLVRELGTAKVEKSAAEKERENIVAANNKKIELAEKTLVGATVQAASMREEEAMQGEQTLLQQRVYANQWETVQERQKELEEATKNLARAQDEYASKLKAAKVATANLDGMSAQQQNAARGLRDGKVWDKMTQKQNWWTERGFDQKKADNYFRAHPDEAAAIGYTPSLSGNDQNRLNYLAGKKASGQELSKSQEKELKDLLDRDPEEQARRKEKEADAAAEKVKAAQEKKEQAEESLKLNVEAIKTMMEKLGLK